MAIVTDPDNLDRDQVILGTNTQKLSLFPVGAKVHASASAATGYASADTQIFRDASADFVTWGVASGDILVLRNGPDASHLIVDSVTDLNTLVVKTDDGFTAFASDPVAGGAVASSLVYGIYDPSGGSIADGVTKQAIYSFSKEEWRTDAYATALSDNLIKHEFPFEAITSEQMEIGGGASHADWVYFNDYTRKKVRTGGWAEKNQAATASTEYTGIITLGSLDSDTQVYYQQVSAQNTPVDFTFLGTVNEAIETYTSAGDDRRSFLKLFARKKAKTYVQSEISDIGVTQIQTIVNRFPLAHADDAAIVAADAQILGQTPWRAGVTTVTASVGVTSAISSTVAVFKDADAPFTASAVVAGDMLFITAAQTDTGYYTVLSVTNASALKIDTTEAGQLTGAATLDYDIFSPIKAADKASNVASDHEDMATAAGASAAVALVSSVAGNFVTKGVAANDILAIASSTAGYEGVYLVVSVISETTMQVDSTDNPFGVSTGNDYKVYAAGMFLQYKNDEVSLSAVGSVTFASTTNKITRETGSWTGDGVTAGTVITFTSTTSNNVSFTVASAGTTDIELIAADQSRVTDENTDGSQSQTAYDGFKRTINNVIYGFNWKVTGNGGLASEVYQFIQHQLRQTIDIDWGAGASRGDVTDLLMSFASPTGTTENMHIDNINADDTNNVTYVDMTGQSRTYPFVSSLTINFNNNLQNDASAVYRMFFTTNPAGNYSTKDAVIVDDADGNDISGNVGGAPSVSKTFDYDGNVQGGRSSGADADVTIVAIGLATAQFVITTGTITRTKGLTFSLVAPLERNYSNP